MYGIAHGPNGRYNVSSECHLERMCYHSSGKKVAVATTAVERRWPLLPQQWNEGGRCTAAVEGGRRYHSSGRKVADVTAAVEGGRRYHGSARKVAVVTTAVEGGRCYHCSGGKVAIVCPVNEESCS